ncbi:hypothetical protein MtrunA17_Chr5g0436071 [Medicago truncatula]|uniref:Uncharacterized protein n=1 Tax=Medicago truncatula TaxID=3880 RepID=A0A396HUL5_MEDTR|nr:hypothetical protein MtrunA17_Chr5g0436071 [Medicago truncatula]
MKMQKALEKIKLHSNFSYTVGIKSFRLSINHIQSCNFNVRV